MLTTRILIVEDERKLAQVLESALSAEHYDVVVAPTGEDGFFRANAESFDLLLLDLLLPGRKGLMTMKPACTRCGRPPANSRAAVHRRHLEDRLRPAVVSGVSTCSAARGEVRS